MLREFGRFPVTAEMRLKKRSDASFPNEKTLSERFGTRRQFAAKIRAYCQGREGFDDIIAICTAALNAQDTATENDEMPRRMEVSSISSNRVAFTKLVEAILRDAENTNSRYNFPRKRSRFTRFARMTQ
jgi:hypothetical protein